MLNRQKTLLLLMKEAARPVSKLELTKWAFILREETPSGGGSAFYDFLPYKYGPFSFCLYREMAALVREGYVEENETWTSTELAEEMIQTLPRTLRHDVRLVTERFSNKRINRLVDYVYSSYP